MHKLGSNLELLNSFEVSVIVMITLGFAIIGLICFASLAPRQQTTVAASFQVFDMHQEIAEAADTVSFIFDIPNEFYKQFYIAFTQVAALPSDVIDNITYFVNSIPTTFNDVKQVALATVYYAQQDLQPSTGQVAGASISLYDQYHGNLDQGYLREPSEASADTVYQYDAPKLNELLSKVDWNRMEMKNEN